VVSPAAPGVAVRTTFDARGRGDELGAQARAGGGEKTRESARKGRITKNRSLSNHP